MSQPKQRVSHSWHSQILVLDPSFNKAPLTPVQQEQHDGFEPLPAGPDQGSTALPVPRINVRTHGQKQVHEGGLVAVGGGHERRVAPVVAALQVARARLIDTEREVSRGHKRDLRRGRQWKVLWTCGVRKDGIRRLAWHRFFGGENCGVPVGVVARRRSPPSWWPHAPVRGGSATERERERESTCSRSRLVP
jgi:hypothetical protein